MYQLTVEALRYQQIWILNLKKKIKNQNVSIFEIMCIENVRSSQENILSHIWYQNENFFWWNSSIKLTIVKWFKSFVDNEFGFQWKTNGF